MSPPGRCVRAPSRPRTPAAVVVAASGSWGTALATPSSAATRLRIAPLPSMYGSSATYLTLHRYGWTEDRYAAWLTDTLAKQLLARPGRA